MNILFPEIAKKILHSICFEKLSRTDLRKKVGRVPNMVFDHIIEDLTQNELIVIDFIRSKNATRPTQFFSITHKGKEKLGIK